MRASIGGVSLVNIFIVFFIIVAFLLTGTVMYYKGYKVNCGSGFTQEQRKYYWEHRDEIVGKIVTIKCKGESRNSKNDDLSMNFPIFTEVRLDKDSESYES